MPNHAKREFKWTELQRRQIGAYIFHLTQQQPDPRLYRKRAGSIGGALQFTGFAAGNWVNDALFRRMAEAMGIALATRKDQERLCRHAKLHAEGKKIDDPYDIVPLEELKEKPKAAPVAQEPQAPPATPRVWSKAEYKRIASWLAAVIRYRCDERGMTENQYRDALVQALRAEHGESMTPRAVGRLLNAGEGGAALAFTIAQAMGFDARDDGERDAICEQAERFLEIAAQRAEKPDSLHEHSVLRERLLKPKALPGAAQTYPEAHAREPVVRREYQDPLPKRPVGRIAASYGAPASKEHEPRVVRKTPVRADAVEDPPMDAAAEKARRAEIDRANAAKRGRPAEPEMGGPGSGDVDAGSVTGHGRNRGK